MVLLRLLAPFVSPLYPCHRRSDSAEPQLTQASAINIRRLGKDLSTKMADIYAQLRQDIITGDVLRPDDAGYKESLRRWSTSSERPAVRTGPNPIDNRGLYLHPFLSCTKVAYSTFFRRLWYE